jgi:DNA-binding transcriptional ArsR family regulator
VHAFDVLGDPVRRHLLERLADGAERSAGELTASAQERFGISQPAVSQHLRVLREHGFVAHRPEGTRRLYRLQAEGLREADAWLDAFRRTWAPRLDALATEIARGKRARKSTNTNRRTP